MSYVVTREVTFPLVKREEASEQGAGKPGIDYIWFANDQKLFVGTQDDTFGTTFTIDDCSVLFLREGTGHIRTTQTARPGCATLDPIYHDLTVTLRDTAGADLTSVNVPEFQAEHRDVERLWRQDFLFDREEFDQFKMCEITFPSMKVEINMA